MRNYSIDILWAKLQFAFAAAGSWLGCFVGGMDALMIALTVFVALDYVSGLMCAIADRTLSSAVGFKGICRKALIFALVGAAHILDTRAAGNGSAIRGAVICFYLSNEGVSLLENAARLGLPVPEKLRQALSQLHGKEEKSE